MFSFAFSFQHNISFWELKTQKKRIFNFFFGHLNTEKKKMLFFFSMDHQKERFEMALNNK
jgi:hypothetical protein